jgi:uncharacterized protein (DUF1330 family)
MAAYIVAMNEVLDPEGYARYAAQVRSTVEKHGGRFLVRGGAYEVLEGELPRRRLIILEFPDKETARRWYSSPDYAPLALQRQKASKSLLLLVDGV